MALFKFDVIAKMCQFVGDLVDQLISKTGNFAKWKFLASQTDDK